MKTAILYGGRSGEHEVSLISAASVLRHLPASYEPILIGIDRTGVWYLQPRDAVEAARSGSGPLGILSDGSRIVAAVPGRGLALLSGEPIPVDVVLPVLHGTFGEDGTIQGLLETAGLAYAGADVLGSAVAMDKEVSKALWSRAGLPVPPFRTVRPADLEPDRFSALAKDLEASFGYPMFVKPACAGSSVGTSKIQNAGDLLPALRSALEWGSKALVEPFLTARELECSVVGNEEPRAYPPGEIVSSHEFYDYDAKYLDPNGAALLIPAPIPEETSRSVMDIAVRAYKLAALSGMARIDFFLDRKDGRIYLNEANTIPGFTHISMFPKMCESGGLPYPELLDLIARLGIRRKREKDGIRYLR
ncbi:MAG: D-alanine--D-alanine ligase [Treponema sp.]|nr:D-alanine--D-alanine ligase [Treponema sp.]